MRELQFDTHTLKYFAGVKEMPAGRFKEFQKYLFEDWGVGTTMPEVDLRLANAFQLVANNTKDKALQELHNLRLTINYIINKLSIKSYALAVLIFEVDGDKKYDYTEDGLKKTVELIEKTVPQQTIEQIVEDIKKNLKLN